MPPTFHKLTSRHSCIVPIHTSTAWKLNQHVETRPAINIVFKNMYRCVYRYNTSAAAVEPVGTKADVKRCICVEGTRPISRTTDEKRPTAVLTSCHQHLDKKNIALEHTAKITSNSQLGRTINACRAEGSSSLNILQWGRKCKQRNVCIKVKLLLAQFLVSNAL